MRFYFGSCILDTDSRELTRNGRAADLSPKAFRLLEVLIERRPRAVTHDELRTELWPDTVAGGTTLARLVSEVRAVIDDRANPARFVRTVHRFGYSFCGAAVEETPRRGVVTSYALQWGLRQIQLVRGENLIGRAPDAAVSIASSKISRRHARVIVNDGGATLEDLGSKNGTYLDDSRLEAPADLRDGDTITIGSTLLIFHVSTDEGTTSTDTAP